MKWNRLPSAALASICLCLLPTLVHPDTPVAKARTATVIFLRHAEKMPETATQKDPVLAEAGKLRAQSIARTLRAVGATRIFATGFKRTQQTAAPLAKQLELKVETYDARRSKQFANQLAALAAGEVAVVVGHSNTVPAMVKALGGELQNLDKRGYLGDNEYDRMIVQVLHAADERDPMRAIQTLDLRIKL